MLWNHFPQKGQTPAFIQGDYLEWELYKMPHERAWYLYLKYQLSGASKLSPN